VISSCECVKSVFRNILSAVNCFADKDMNDQKLSARLINIHAVRGEKHIAQLGPDNTQNL